MLRPFDSMHPAVQPSFAMARRRRARAAVAAALAVTAAAPAWSADDASCPDVTGQYAMTRAGSDHAQRIVPQVIHADASAYPRVLVVMDGSTAVSSLTFRVKDSSKSPYRYVVVSRGLDYECKGGWISFGKKIDAGWMNGGEGYEGEATVHIAPAAGKGLTVRIAFTGSQRTVVYSYDSARLSLPKPFTRKSFEETLHWPDAASVAQPAPTQAVEPEAPDVAAVRKMLSDRVLWPARLVSARLRSNGVLVALKVPTSNDVAKLEQRLRDAGIAYRVTMPPTWSDRSHHMEMLVDPKPAARGADATGNAASAPSGRPHAARVAPAPVQQRPTQQQVRDELQRALSSPLVNLQAVVASGDSYIATLTLLPGMSPEQAIERLKARSTLIAQVEPIGDAPRSDLPRARDVSWRLRTQQQQQQPR